MTTSTSTLTRRLLAATGHLTARVRRGTWVLEDPDGGIWWPAGSPRSERGVRRAYVEGKGVWHQ